jgi:probable HAF family extracellular repeat protein
MTDLGSFGGELSRATAINDNGQAVGFSYTTGNAEVHAFIYDSRGMVDIGTLSGNQSYAYDINSTGQIVGNSNGRAFLYSNGTMYDLNDLIDSNWGWMLEDAGAINDAGQIAVVGSMNGRNHVLLLNPIPEPGTLVLLALGIVGVGLRRRK